MPTQQDTKTHTIFFLRFVFPFLPGERTRIIDWLVFLFICLRDILHPPRLYHQATGAGILTQTRFAFFVFCPFAR